MKVLICNKFYRPFGGPETQVRETTKLLEADGHEVIPFSMSHPDNWPSKWSEYFVPQVDYHAAHGIVSQMREAANMVYSRQAKASMERLLDAAQPDLAHMHNIYHQLSPSILGPLKKRGIPVVMSLHDYKLACPNMLFYVGGEMCERCAGGKFHNAITHKCVFGSTPKSALCALEMYIHRFLHIYQQNVDVFVSPSQFLIDALTRCGAAGKRMIHLPALAGIDSYTPTFEDDGYVFCLGKLTAEKGIDTLIRAISISKDARLVVAGTGACQPDLEKLAEELAPGRVEFVGFLTGDKLKRTMERCAVFVIPSVWYENCPATVLEAFSAGKPVIGSRIGGIPELIEDGVDGLLFTPGNAEDLAETICQLLPDKTRIATMGRQGRDKMEQKYSRRTHYTQLTEIYRELVPEWPAS